MKLNDRVYEILKWVGLVCLPALAWYVVEIGIENAEQIAKILNATGTLLGILIGVSTYNYRKGDAPHAD